MACREAGEEQLAPSTGPSAQPGGSRQGWTPCLPCCPAVEEQCELHQETEPWESRMCFQAQMLKDSQDHAL